MAEVSIRDLYMRSAQSGLKVLVELSSTSIGNMKQSLAMAFLTISFWIFSLVYLANSLFHLLSGTISPNGTRNSVIVAAVCIMVCVFLLRITIHSFKKLGKTLLEKLA